MNVVKCSMGHFFDGDAYQVCPHCGAPVGTIAPSAQPNIKEKKWGLFSGHKSKGEYVAPQPTVSVQPADSGAFGSGNDPTIDLPQEPATSSTPAEKEKDVTLDFWQTSTTPAPVEPARHEPEEDDRKTAMNIVYASPETMGCNIPAEQEKKEEDSEGLSPVLHCLPGENPATRILDSEETPTSQTVSLKDAVRQASASSEGKTMSYFSAVTGGGNKSEENKPLPNRPVDPVVGWLVCTQGEHFGESFNIGAGMNSIGRNETNRIVLNRDPSISREKHALITYEPKHRRFYIKPGDSSGLTYLNDEYITETKPIMERDIIELGNSKFIFVPLCCDSFTWEDYIKG